MLSTRPSDDELFMRVAQQVTTRSLCDRDQVGAVIVDTQMRIVATGRNGPPAGFPHKNMMCTAWCSRADKMGGDVEPLSLDYSDCPSIHAEANALLSSDRSRHEGGTIYVTSDPCWSCGKMIANSGLLTIVVLSHPGKAYARNAEQTYSFLESLGINVIFHGEQGEDHDGGEKSTHSVSVA
jgi:dCMP deaminase